MFNVIIPNILLLMIYYLNIVFLFWYKNFLIFCIFPSVVKKNYILKWWLFWNKISLKECINLFNLVILFSKYYVFIPKLLLQLFVNVDVKHSKNVPQKDRLTEKLLALIPKGDSHLQVALFRTFIKVENLPSGAALVLLVSFPSFFLLSTRLFYTHN